MPSRCRWVAAGSPRHTHTDTCCRRRTAEGSRWGDGGRAPESGATHTTALGTRHMNTALKQISKCYLMWLSSRHQYVSQYNGINHLLATGTCVNLKKLTDTTNRNATLTRRRLIVPFHGEGDAILLQVGDTFY